MKYTYRKITVSEIDKLKEINPAQYIGQAWREVEGKRVLIEINYHDTDWPNGYDYHRNHLLQTIEGGGYALGAFSQDNQLQGFITVNREVFGINYKYLLIDQLFITLEERKKGLGRKLFQYAVQKAKSWKADKLYICAGSAEETIAFYHAMGCKDALEINRSLYEGDSRDMQLEVDLEDFKIQENSHE
ncbi:GNAT family N-acetyltransferase [bacterium]|nr:GNAT family N-acetyltransferase [bacterium]